MIRTAIQRRISTAIVALGLAIFGALNIRTLPVDFLPEIKYPLIKLSIVWPGATPLGGAPSTTSRALPPSTPASETAGAAWAAALHHRPSPSSRADRTREGRCGMEGLPGWCAVSRGSC